MSSEHKKRRSIWGPELILVIVLPLIVVAAIAVTIWIAQNRAFSPDPDVQTNRFAQPIDGDS